MATPIEEIIKKAQSAVTKITVKSGLNPILWLCALISLPCFILACYFNSGLSIVLIIIGCAPIGTACFGFFYFMIKGPDYLRSEKFHLQKHSLELLGEKGNEFNATANHIVAVTKPQEYLPDPSDKNE